MNLGLGLEPIEIYFQLFIAVMLIQKKVRGEKMGDFIKDTLDKYGVGPGVFVVVTIFLTGAIVFGSGVWFGTWLFLTSLSQ